jgi:hypothetical protein
MSTYEEQSKEKKNVAGKEDGMKGFPDFHREEINGD